MGVPTSEVGYTSAMPRREDHEVHKDMWVHWGRSKSEGKSVPLQSLRGPEGSRKLRFPDFVTTTQDGGRLSTLCTGRLYPQEILLVLISVRG